MSMNFRASLLAAMFLLLAAGCNQGGDSAPAADSEAANTESAGGTATMPRTASVEGASVHFVTPRDGAIVSNPVVLNFAATGMSVVPAGDDAPMSGHHHVIIDADLPPMDLPIPADDNHVHFGDGSSTTELTLTPGEHTLQLVFADYLHIPHNPPVVSDKITITVE